MLKNATTCMAAVGVMLPIMTGCAGVPSRHAPPHETAIVIVECVLGPGGRMSDCVVASEQPAGQGFGEAALSGARQSRVNLSDTPGARPGETVRFSMRFRPE